MAMNTWFSLLQGGVLQLSPWVLVIVTLVLTHITIIAVTLYLHRCQAHRGLDLHPALAHFLRFWLWFTTGMVTKEWVAIHRKHHAKCEREGDPHSPAVFGFSPSRYGVRPAATKPLPKVGCRGALCPRR